MSLKQILIIGRLLIATAESVPSLLLYYFIFMYLGLSNLFDLFDYYHYFVGFY